MNSHVLTLFRQQLTSRSRSILVWIIVWSLLGLLFVSVFNDLSKNAAQSMNIYDSLPKGVLEAFNIGNDYLTKSEKFLSGQFLSVYLLAGGIFSVFMGIGAVGSKIEDKTIANLLTKPLSRVSIYVAQALTNAITLLLASCGAGAVIFGLFSTLGTEKNLSTSYFVGAFVGAGCVFITFSLLGQLLGMLGGKGHGQAIGGALVFGSFFLNGLGALAGVPSWLQKCSLFYYLDSAQLRDTYHLNGPRLIILAIVAVVLLIAGVTWFRRKDIYL
jgi:ABC-type transport system involved in multi-copper enzyme maturation permease subunit